MSRDSENGKAPDHSSQIWQLVLEHYNELLRYAFKQIAREGPGQSLDPQALINELVIRMAAAGQPAPVDATHFLATAKLTMKHILTDRARHKGTQRAGGQFRRQKLDSDVADAKTDFSGLLVFQEELRILGKQNLAAAKIVEWHCQGYSIAEAAKMIGVSRSSAYELWKFGSDWLIKSLIDPNSSRSNGNHKK